MFAFECQQPLKRDMVLINQQCFAPIHSGGGIGLGEYFGLFGQHGTQRFLRKKELLLLFLLLIEEDLTYSKVMGFLTSVKVPPFSQKPYLEVSPIANWKGPK